MRLASFHSITEFEDLLGIRPKPPNATAETSRTWRLPPGYWPRSYGYFPWGAAGVISVQWSEARPVIWDVDLPGDATGGAAVFASGLSICEPDGWWYYEPPGRDPFLLAGVLRGESMSLAVHSSTRFPAVLPEEFAPAWIANVAGMRTLLDSLPPTDRSWWRSTRIANPDTAREDSKATVAPLLVEPPRTRRD